MAYEMVFSSYQCRPFRVRWLGESTPSPRSCGLSRWLWPIAATRFQPPLATLLFAGPTGSGKMHVAQALARVLLGNECKSIYVNCQILGQQPNPHPQSGLYEQLMAGSALSQMTPPFTQSPLSVVVFEKIELAPRPSAITWRRL